ncbi:allene oxide synthase-lipoxygenase protein-like [Ostrea edulis]|uniref:allene oxide synthase-lipoxygenase protein-like n=1 Tax=Ostrea edulis TaxID=37623 RepID=UPI0020960778|nr:allene oxide synthase-lipoxygenase protein-like [Ostrea edulis]
MGNTQPPSLPNQDPNIEVRNLKLECARQKYQLEQKTFGLTSMEQREINIVNVPPMLRKLPREQNWRLPSLLRFGLRYLFYTFVQCLCGWGKCTLRKMACVFSCCRCILEEPQGRRVWRTESVNQPNQTQTQKAQADHWFAWQRLNGVTRNLIRRATEIPKQFLPFVDTIEENHPYLSDKKFSSHIQNGTLFVVDLEEVAFNEPTLLAPVALLVIYNNMLMPVAIRTDPRNPDNKEIATPPLRESNSPEQLRKWVKAKMWFNMLDAQYHESVTHLGFTHLLMDGVSVCVHRNLSERHPIYKLMLPHFHYMHFINQVAVKELVEPGGYVDRDMYFGQKNMIKLISKHNENWKFKEHGCIVQNFLSRGVQELPGYYFKDDATYLHEAITNYVREYVTHYYGGDDEINQDPEIQAFRAQLIAPRSMSGDEAAGCGMKDVPEFDGVANLVTVLANFIYICSVEHSATNFPQYDQYGFLPNMPAILNGQPEFQIGENELNAPMPTAREFFSTIKIMMVLTLVLTNSLGKYESRYQNAMDAAGKRIVRKFQRSLDDITTRINARNTTIQNTAGNIEGYPYEWLLPKRVLNSISI